MPHTKRVPSLRCSKLGPVKKFVTRLVVFAHKENKNNFDLILPAFDYTMIKLLFCNALKRLESKTFWLYDHVPERNATKTGLCWSTKACLHWTEKKICNEILSKHTQAKRCCQYVVQFQNFSMASASGTKKIVATWVTSNDHSVVACCVDGLILPARDSSRNQNL